MEPKPPHAPSEAELRVELDHAVVDVVGHVHVAGRVEGDAVGEAELARAAAVGADRALEGAFGVEFLDAVVVVVGDDHLAFVGRDPAWVGELAGAAARRSPTRCASPPSRLKRSMRLLPLSATYT